MTNHRDLLEQLAERGQPRGAESVLAAARGGAPKAVPDGGPRRPRPWLALAAFAAVVAVGAVAIWATRGTGPTDPDPAATVPSETVTTTATTTTDSTATTQNTAPHIAPPSVPGMVAFDDWPHPALAPVLALPACPNPAELAAFLAEEFPEEADHPFESVDPAVMAAMLPMPRTGTASVFTQDHFDGACLDSGSHGDALGWLITGRDGNAIARAAGLDIPVEWDLPPELYEGTHFQSALASRHSFYGSSLPFGRVQAVTGGFGGRYAVFESALFADLDGDSLSPSLAMQPFAKHSVYAEPLIEPVLLPAGFGPCLITQPAENIVRSVFCDADGAEIELAMPGYSLHLPSFSPPAAPADARATRVGAAQGTTWSEGATRIVLVSLPREAFTALELPMWAIGPAGLPDGVLEAILASAPILQPELLSPRIASGPSLETVTPSLLTDLVVDAGAVDVTSVAGVGVSAGASFTLGSDVDGQVFIGEASETHTPGDRAAFALTVGMTGSVALGQADALIRDSANSFQVIFECGVAVNVSFRDSSPVPLATADHEWSRDPERRARMLAFVESLSGAICET